MWNKLKGLKMMLRKQSQWNLSVWKSLQNYFWGSETPVSHSESLYLQQWWTFPHSGEPAGLTELS